MPRIQININVNPDSVVCLFPPSIQLLYKKLVDSMVECGIDETEAKEYVLAHLVTALKDIMEKAKADGSMDT